MNQGAIDHMLHDKFKIGADAAAAAGPVGRNAQAATDIELHAEFLTYSRSRGLFAGIDLNGAALSQDSEDTRGLYGSDDLLQDGSHWRHSDCPRLPSRLCAAWRNTS